MYLAQREDESDIKMCSWCENNPIFADHENLACVEHQDLLTNPVPLLNEETWHGD